MYAALRPSMPVNAVSALTRLPHSPEFADESSPDALGRLLQLDDRIGRQAGEVEVEQENNRRHEQAGHVRFPF